MKRYIAALIAAVLICSLCACGGKTAGTTSSSETAGTVESKGTSSAGTESVSTDGYLAVTVPDAGYHAENEYMEIAIAEARTGIYNSDGGPFGSVIVRDGEIIGQGHNMVLRNNDSTCHGEISAIRNAESALGTFDLSGAVLYTTGEPCPMCLAACMWANIDTVYYGCTIEDNEMIGFRDKKFDEMFGGREAFSDYLVETDRDACLKLFEEYMDMDAENY